MSAEQKLKNLQQMKNWCLALLFFCIGMSVLLEMTFPHTQKLWLVFLKGMFEAAVVGAMADWYAVVALFKHPLGISALPHTAIIRRKKDDIGKNLGNFVRDEFMQDDVVIKKVEDFRPIEKLFTWIETREKKYFVSRFLGKAIVALLNDKSAAYINEFARTNLFKLAQSTDVAPLLAKIINVFNNDIFRNDCINLVLDKVLPYMHSEKDEWIAMAKSSGVWGTKWIGGKYIDGFIEAMLRKLEEIRDDETHPARDEVKDILTRWLNELHQDPQAVEAVNRFKMQFIESPQFVDFINSGIAQLKEKIVDDLQSQDSHLIDHMHSGIMALAKKYRTDTEFNDYLNNLLKKFVRWMLSYKNTIAEHLAEQVKSWSPESVSQKLELEIGKDLQWIRVSGTIVGGLVGGVFATALFLIR